MTVTWSCGRWSREIKLAKPESYSVDFFYFSAGWPLWPDPLPGRRALLQTHRKHQEQGHPIQAAAVQQISLPATSTSLAQCSCQLNPLSDHAAAKSKPVLLTTELHDCKSKQNRRWPCISYLLADTCSCIGSIQLQIHRWDHCFTTDSSCATSGPWWVHFLTLSLHQNLCSGS